MPAGLKDIHFQVPEGLAIEFYKMYPGHGERKAILIKFVQEAIRLKSQKDYFISLVKNNVAMNKDIK